MRIVPWDLAWNFHCPRVEYLSCRTDASRMSRLASFRLFALGAGSVRSTRPCEDLEARHWQGHSAVFEGPAVVYCDLGPGIYCRPSLAACDLRCRYVGISPAGSIKLISVAGYKSSHGSCVLLHTQSATAYRDQMGHFVESLWPRPLNGLLVSIDCHVRIIDTNELFTDRRLEVGSSTRNITST